MPEDQPQPETLRLDPPIAVPEPAPLAMPPRHLRRFPIDLGRWLPRFAVPAREARGTGPR